MRMYKTNSTTDAKKAKADAHNHEATTSPVREEVHEKDEICTKSKEQTKKITRKRKSPTPSPLLQEETQEIQVSQYACMSICHPSTKQPIMCGVSGTRHLTRINHTMLYHAAWLSAGSQTNQGVARGRG